MEQSDDLHGEARALRLGTLGNLIGAVGALVFSWRSGSDALMLDGLYSAVMAGASVIAQRVTVAAQQPRSRAYPFGASGQEPLYVLFRTLVLLGIVTFAIATAAGKLISHLQGNVLQPLQLTGLSWYFSAMVLLNIWLWLVFNRAWARGAHQNVMLQSMASSARVDALICAGTGMALLGSPWLLDTPLAPVVPIADSLLVLLLSLVLLPEPVRILRAAVAEAAGSGRSISAAVQIRCCEAIGPSLQQADCQLLELAMIRLGRTITAVAYVEPVEAMSAMSLDTLRRQVEQQLMAAVQSAVLCEVIITSEHPYTDKAC